MSTKGYYETDKYVFFYGSFFSQWAKYDILIDNIKYNCCEQYMMAEKARIFDDDNAFEQIMKSKDPSIQKSWGRKVKNFDKEKWEKRAKYIVETANYAKFTQYEDLQRMLLDTGDKIIVEASPWDCVWGAGLKADDKRILDPKNWRGTNWLGEVIMGVRDLLMIQQAKGHLEQDW